MTLLFEVTAIFDMRTLDEQRDLVIGTERLVATLASTRQKHGEIKLVRPNQRVTELLQRTRLNTVFKSYESDEEAVTAFRTNS